MSHISSVRAAAARAFLGASPGGGGAVPRAERGRSSRAAVRRAASSATARGSSGGRAGLPRAPPPAPAPAPASRAGRATPGRAACGRRRRHCRSLGAPQRGGPGRRAARSDRPGVVFSARRGARGRGGGRARRGGGGGAALTRMRRPRPCGEPTSGPRRFPRGPERFRRLGAPTPASLTRGKARTGAPDSVYDELGVPSGTGGLHLNLRRTKRPPQQEKPDSRRCTSSRSWVGRK